MPDETPLAQAIALMHERFDALKDLLLRIDP